MEWSFNLLDVSASWWALLSILSSTGCSHVTLSSLLINVVLRRVMIRNPQFWPPLVQYTYSGKLSHLLPYCTIKLFHDCHVWSDINLCLLMIKGNTKTVCKTVYLDAVLCHSTLAWRAVPYLRGRTLCTFLSPRWTSLKINSPNCSQQFLRPTNPYFLDSLYT